ncbi:30S ribosomal protein S18 [Phanerochaete sordida]|uniref:Small ribosomal subunit protein bS18m n=1 Tax=Phanerochaete sordida TaxID=48140 RepID=A0A9P3FVZ8_9APHY|nr:30S ribosomal protein S18 [Phanerochaete sordida]
MLAQCSFFRAAARHAPRVQSTPAATVGVGSSRLFSSSGAIRNEKDAHLNLFSALSNAQTVTDQRATAAAIQPTYNVQLKPLHPTFVFPKDFSMQSRIPRDRISKKPAALGPRRAEAQRSDVFYQQQIDPLDEAMNSFLMSAFVTEMGKIKSRAETALTWRSQRRVGKAIRRARNMGIIPLLSRRALKDGRE